MQAEMNEALAKDQLVSALMLRQSKLDAEQLAVRRDIAQEQLATRAEATRAQIAVQQSSVDQARAVLQLRQRQKGELRVSAGLTGVLQLVSGRRRPAGRARREPRARRQSRAAQSRNQNRGNPGQRRTDRPERHRRYSQRDREWSRDPHRSVRPERHENGGCVARRRSAEGRRPRPERRRHDRTRAVERRGVHGPSRVRAGPEHRRDLQGDATGNEATRVQVQLGKARSIPSKSCRACSQATK